MDIVSHFEHLVGTNWQAAFVVIFNLIIIESLLSVDNAAVLATLVMPLPKRERKRALRIGIFFAYIFRGACLLLASYLIQVKWLKLLGGLYLLYLAFQFFFLQVKPEEGNEKPVSQQRFQFLSPFWSTVLMVETMDILFSIDNVFAAVAFTSNIYLICTGVFIGIIAMRTVASYFVKLMEHYPMLNQAAFIVIALLGFKLFISSIGSYYPNQVSHLLESEGAEIYFSASTVIIFLMPILFAFIRKEKIN